MGLGQFNSLEEYCGLHTASSVFLILVHSYQLSESNEYVNKIKLFLWQRGLCGEAARRGGEERAGEAAVCE